MDDHPPRHRADQGASVPEITAKWRVNKLEDMPEVETQGTPVVEARATEYSISNQGEVSLTFIRTKCRGTPELNSTLRV